MADGNGIEAQLAARIEAEGPIPVAFYMAEANAHYYGTRDPLGARGDFITAPEISQMFGELIGLWLADLWARAGAPAGAHYVELGPGRGTLALDALRAMRAAGLEPTVDLLETSAALREIQATRLSDARWHSSLDTLPRDAPLLVVANEFFDALPIRQFVKTGAGWCERRVDRAGGRFVPVAGPPAHEDAVPPEFAEAPAGTIFERAPAAAAIAWAISERIVAQGGAALIVDYGHARSAPGETLQSVRGHAFADPWANPGEQDLTAHVDFEALADAVRPSGAALFGPAEQGPWLEALGLEARAAALAQSAPARGAEIEAARVRLTAPDQMGSLFKLLAIAAPGWPAPAGFEGPDP